MQSSRVRLQCVRLRAHLLQACHDGEKTSSECHVNRMMFVWLLVSSGWHYGYDTVLMHRSIQGNSLSISERFGRDRKLCEEVIRTQCFTTKDFYGGHRHGQKVWHRTKIFLACFWHEEYTDWLWSLCCPICRRKKWKHDVRQYFIMAAKFKMANF